MSALEPLRSLNSRLFGDIVFFKAYLALLLLALTSGAEAASDPLCKSAPNGIWRISSYRLDAGVIAVSTAEAESRMGKPVSIGPKSVSFPGYGRCAVSGKKVEAADDYKRFPISIVYDCSNKVYLPAFFAGPRCDRILASLDGATYILTRRH